MRSTATTLPLLPAMIASAAATNPLPAPSQRKRHLGQACYVGAVQRLHAARVHGMGCHGFAESEPHWRVAVSQA